MRYTAFNARPYVGYVSSGESVEIVRRESELICRQSAAASLFLWLILGMVPLVGYFCVTSAEMAQLLHDLSNPGQDDTWLGLMLLLIGTLFGSAFMFAAKKLVSLGHIAVDSAGTIRLYRGRGSDRPERVIRPQEVKRLAIQSVSFQGRQTVHINYLLILKLNNGEETVLCASTEWGRMEGLQRDMMERMGRRIDEALEEACLSNAAR
jgi:hypothetical protein